jgi:3-dehydroquinate synthetase
VLNRAARAAIGQQLGLTERGTAQQIGALASRFGLPHQAVSGPIHEPVDQLLAAMQTDKKNRDGRIRLALLERIGVPRGSDAVGWTNPVSEADIRTALRG